MKEYKLTENNTSSKRVIFRENNSSIRDGTESIRRIDTSSKRVIFSENNINDILISACVNNNYKMVKKLIYTKNIKVNNKNIFGDTALKKAVLNNNLKIVKLLLKAGAHIDCKDDCGITPLMLSCHLNYIKMTDLLLKKNANQNIIKVYKNAVVQKNYDIIKLLLSYGLKLNIKDEDSDMQLIFFLLDSYKCENNTSCKEASSPSVNSFISDETESIRRIDTSQREASCSKNISYKECISSLLISYFETLADTEILEFKYSRSENNTNVLMFSCLKREKIFLKYLLNRKIFDINEKNYDGLNCGMFACKENTVDVMDFLIENGLNPNETDNSNNNLLMYAVKYNNIEMIEYFIEKKFFDINSENLAGDTALIIAGKNGYKKCQKILLDNGANIYIKNKEGDTYMNFF